MREWSHLAGINHQTGFSILTSRRKGGIDKLKSLARVAGMTIDQLLEWIEARKLDYRQGENSLVE